MGGHGALISALKRPGQYQSVSAFAPICHPSACPWGNKAFTGYLGPDKEAWKEYDACALLEKYSGPPLMILVDQGSADNFLTQKQLLPEDLVEASQKSRSVSVVLQMQSHYDHSFYFIASFIGSHFAHHAKYLTNYFETKP
ncbi:putative esterase [Trinorchestia longiramus]|nr:putative esterase [Trinorchestia longiramus]